LDERRKATQKPIPDAARSIGRLLLLAVTTLLVTVSSVISTQELSVEHSANLEATSLRCTILQPYVNTTLALVLNAPSARFAGFAPHFRAMQSYLFIPVYPR
jgi:hypothetical protein